VAEAFVKKPAPTSDNPADDVLTIPPQGVVVGSGRLRVTQRDLDMYAALVGVPQTLLLEHEPSLPASRLRIDRTRLSSWVRGLSHRAQQQFHQAKMRFRTPGRKPRA